MFCPKHTAITIEHKLGLNHLQTGNYSDSVLPYYTVDSSYKISPFSNQCIASSDVDQDPD